MHIIKMADMPEAVPIEASRALEGGQTLLEAGHRGVAVAAIGVALLFAGKAACRGLGVGLHIAAGQEQGFGVFAVLAAVPRRRAAPSVSRCSAGWRGLGDMGTLQNQESGLGRARRELSCSSLAVH
jgi:hypothetical protein